TSSEGSIGGSIGSTVGGMVGAAVGNLILPGFGTIIGPFIGSFVGDILGTLVGDLFGDTGPAVSVMNVGTNGNGYVSIVNAIGDDGGDPEIFRPIASAVRDETNQLLGMTGGHVTEVKN